MKRIAIVVNKNWEVEPFLSSLTGSEIRPAKLPFPKVMNSPRDGNNKMDIPRCILSLSNNETVILEVTVWCIQDLMFYNIPPDPKQSSSSSDEKYRVLKNILSEESLDLVIAVGTAGYPSDTSYNGSVVVGANFFVHNGHLDNPKSALDLPEFGKMLPSNVNDKLFDIVTKDFKNATESKFIPTPRNPSSKPVCIASKVFTALSSVNVTDYSEYNWIDKEAIDHFKMVEKKLPLSSIETTHGVIKLSTKAPIIFTSAISDRLGHFDMEVTASQNYVAAFNAGIVVGHLLCSLNELAIKDFDFKLQEVHKRYPSSFMSDEI